MNKHVMKRLILLSFVIVITNGVFSQNSCLECPNNFAIGLKSTAIGTGCTAEGDYSFASGNNNFARGLSSISMGYYSETLGHHAVSIGRNCIASSRSYAIGDHAIANGEPSVAIGHYVQSSASKTITIGSADNQHPLDNNIPSSLMIGFESPFPTFFVGPTPYGQEFGKVGIGTIDPVATLDVNGGIRVKGFAMPTVNMQEGYVLTCNGLGTADWAPGFQSLSYWTETHYGSIYRADGFVGLSTDFPTARLQIGNKWTFNDRQDEIKSIGYNTTFAASRYYRMTDGPASLITFEPSGAISFQTATTGIGGIGIEEFTETAIFDNFGNVGIGTRTPTERLDVNGKIKTTEFQLLNGNLNEYILRCDNDGNAYWANPADLDDGDWNMIGNNIWVDENKNVGIGINSPNEKLHINGNMLITRNILGGRNNWSPLKICAGTTTDDGAYLSLYSSISSSGSLGLHAKANGWINFYNQNMQVMSIRDDNTIYMGNSNPGYEITLYVNGYIEANKVRVSTESWYDEVLEPDYKLLSLKQLESFIVKNNHLPDIPSEKEVLENGIDVGNMNAILLKKIEELTLYTIEQQKEIEQLKRLVKELIETK